MKNTKAISVLIHSFGFFLKRPIIVITKVMIAKSPDKKISNKYSSISFFTKSFLFRAAKL